MKYIVWLLMSFIATSSSAQGRKFSYKLGEAYGLPRKTDDLAFIGNNKDGIMNLSLKDKELIILKFNPKNLTQASEQSINLPEATKNFNSEDVISIGGNYYWLHSDRDKDDNELLYYDKIDVANGKLAGSNLLIKTTKIDGRTPKTGFLTKMKTVDKYKFNFDAVRKYLLITYRLIPEKENDKKNYDKLGFAVFDANMNKVWANEYTMPYTEAVMDNSDFCIDQNANAYLLARVFNSDDRHIVDKKNLKPDYRFEVLKFSKDNNQISKTVIDLDQFYIREAKLIETKNNDLMVICSYGKKPFTGTCSGLYLANIDNQGTLHKYNNTGYFNFSSYALSASESGNAGDEVEVNDTMNIANLKIQDIIVGNDGNIFIACEQFYTTSSANSDRSAARDFSRFVSPNDAAMRDWYYQRFQTAEKLAYHYEDIYAIKLQASGKVEWIRKIPKRQNSQYIKYGYYEPGHPYTGSMSFKLMADSAGYYFLLVDNEKNVNLGVYESPGIHLDGFGGQLMVAKLDQKGKITKEILFDTKSEDIDVYPTEFDQINNNQFIGRAKAKKDTFVPLIITVK